jgi:SNF2 family DNA or RNA helicase
MKPIEPFLQESKPKMRPPTDLFPYEQKAIEFQCARSASALWLDMGLGKTIVTLTSINYLLTIGALRGVVIVAPIRVCRMVWRQEAVKWSHTQQLRFAMMVGDRDQRSRALMNSRADIWLINYENLEWFAQAIETYYLAYNRPLPFNGIVFDEISKCKNSTTHRVKALRKVLPGNFIWRTGLTGEPASNGYKDLHGQYLVLDDGTRLGTSKSQFETRWYKQSGNSRKWIPYEDTQAGIRQRIGDITLEMSAADYNPLPNILFNDVLVDLPEPLREMYDRMERDFFIRLDSGAEVEMFNQASLMNKCLQFSNGAMYPVAGMPLWEPIHDLKLDALEDILEEANGQPVLCAYAYVSDSQRIMQRFHKLDPINLTACKTERALHNAMERWTTGRCRLMIGHPGSMGHGLDGLQHCGHIVAWYGLNWSLDLYDQMNARIRRQGQGVPVICHRILCANTLDQAQLLALAGKAQTQSALRDAIRQYRHERS